MKAVIYIALLCLLLSGCSETSTETSPATVISSADTSALPADTTITDVTAVVSTNVETTPASTLPPDTSAFATSIDDSDAQQIALEIYERLLQSFGTDDTISNRRLDTTLYPDTYAGAYYEDGMLNIYLTDTSEEVTRQYAEITGTDHVRFVKKEFSYTYLTALYDDICLLMPEGTWGIRTAEVSQYENIVKIGVSSEPNVAALSQKLTESGYNDGSFYIYVNNMVITPR